MKKSLEQPSESFCILPWVHLFADNMGIMRPCCRTVGERQMTSRDPDGNPYVVYHPDGIEEAWNASFMREVRLDMLNGRRPPVCRHCWRDEDLGVRSSRQRANVRFAPYIEEALAQTKTNGSAPTNLIRSADFRLGNLCNLRCRMCAPFASKGLIGEWADYYNLADDDPRLLQMRQLDWHSKEAFWQTFENYVPQIEELQFAGGEPFIMPQMFDFLEQVIAMGRASEIVLRFTSNLTVFPERIFELWPHFKRVRIDVSLDGYDQVNNFIRYPTNWQTLDRNMRRLDAQAKQLNCWQGLSINSTVQIYNIFNLDKLLAYTATAFSHFEPPALPLLVYPAHLSIQILPQEMKEAAAERLRNFIDDYAGRWPKHWQGSKLDGFLSAVDAVIEHMFSADQSLMLPEFRRWTNHLDRNRKQDIQAIIPELVPLFAE